MNCLRQERNKRIKDSLIKDVRSLFRLKKTKPDGTVIKDMRTLFRLKRNEAIKNRITRDITILFDRKEVDYYIPVRVGILYNDNYIQYENHSDKNKTL